MWLNVNQTYLNIKRRKKNPIKICKHSKKIKTFFPRRKKKFQIFKKNGLKFITHFLINSNVTYLKQISGTHSKFINYIAD